MTTTFFKSKFHFFHSEMFTLIPIMYHSIIMNLWQAKLHVGIDNRIL